MKWTIILVVLLLLFANARPALASDAFRCGSELIQRGDTTVETLISCGKPSYTQVLNPGFKGSRVENWFYDCGFGGFLYALRFVEGRLQDVKTEGYGHGQSACLGALNR
jgi:hypothetical protein